MLPDFLGRVLGRLNRNLVSTATEKESLERIRVGDAVCLWSDISTKLIERLKDQNVPIFREKFNGLKLVQKEILDNVYERLCLPPGHKISDQDIYVEFKQLKMVDFIFVASPIAADDFVRCGFSKKQIIRSSYGWDPSRIVLPNRTNRSAIRDDPVNFLFVGVATVQKGVDLLIRSWVRSEVKGRLILAGPISPEINRICGEYFKSGDISCLGWVDDVSSVLKRADVFVFRSHQETGPLVTYEAMGSGLPVIVSPMGAGAIARNEEDGFVIDPYDEDKWISAIRRLAKDPEFRLRMGQNARKRAKDFTWDKVGARRQEAVLVRLLSTKYDGGKCGENPDRVL